MKRSNTSSVYFVPTADAPAHLSSSSPMSADRISPQTSFRPYHNARSLLAPTSPIGFDTHTSRQPPPHPAPPAPYRDPPPHLRPQSNTPSGLDRLEPPTTWYIYPLSYGSGYNHLPVRHFPETTGSPQVSLTPFMANLNLNHGVCPDIHSRYQYVAPTPISTAHALQCVQLPSAIYPPARTTDSSATEFAVESDVEEEGDGGADCGYCDAGSDPRACFSDQEIQAALVLCSIRYSSMSRDCQDR